jgi:hypothetical protein
VVTEDTVTIAATEGERRAGIMQVFGPYQLQGPPHTDELAELWPAYRWAIEVGLEADHRVTDHHFGPFFYGLPPTPPSIAWFGPGYVPLIPAEIRQRSFTQDMGRVLLMMFGDQSPTGGIVEEWMPADLTYSDPDPIQRCQLVPASSRATDNH